MGTGLLRAPAHYTALVENDRTGECVEATADEDGVLRNDDGESFSAGAYTTVAGSYPPDES